jgi:hypothetical protein
MHKFEDEISLLICLTSPWGHCLPFSIYLFVYVYIVLVLVWKIDTLFYSVMWSERGWFSESKFLASDREGEFVGGLVVKVYRVRLCMCAVYGYLIKNCLLYFWDTVYYLDGMNGKCLGSVSIFHCYRDALSGFFLPVIVKYLDPYNFNIIVILNLLCYFCIFLLSHLIVAFGFLFITELVQCHG